MSELSKILTFAGIGIGGLSYFCKEGIDWLERSKSSLEDELAAHRISLNQQSTQIQILEIRQQMESIQRENLPERRRKPTNINYSGMIQRDMGAVRAAQAQIHSSEADVLRLIEKIPFRTADLQKTLEDLKAKTEASDCKAKEVLKPSPENDWVRAGQVKLAFVTTLVNGLPVLVFGDTVITRAKNQADLLNSIIRVGRWAVRILFVLGVSLTVYGVIKGIKVPSGAGE